MDLFHFYNPKTIEETKSELLEYLGEDLFSYLFEFVGPNAIELFHYGEFRIKFW